jgi:hypothetical protein
MFAAIAITRDCFATKLSLYFHTHNNLAKFKELHQLYQWQLFCQTEQIACQLKSED